MHPTLPIIKIKDLSLVYNKGKSSEFKALKNINVEIFPEEFVIFFGPSGSGKSTLLYIIAGLETPTSGSVQVGDKKDIFKLSEKELMEYHRSAMGMIFQAFYLIPSLTAKDNILLPMVFAGVSQKKREEAVKSLLDRFGITSFQDRTPSHLSGGQQQRIAIARSLINNPSIVLADEPVGNLDSKNSEIVLQLITELRTKDKKTVILVTHDPSHLKHADRVVYIKDGEVVRVVEQKAVIMKANNEEPAPEKEQGKRLIDRLALLFPQLDEVHLKAKLLTNFVLLPYDVETINQVEQAVALFLKKTITREELFKKLDSPEEEGGVGLYSQTAEKIVREVTKLLKEEQGIAHRTIRPEEVVEFLLKSYKGTVTIEQKTRLIGVIKEHFKATESVAAVQELLDKPISKGGVGLNERTAKHFAQELEVLRLETK